MSRLTWLHEATHTLSSHRSLFPETGSWYSKASDTGSEHIRSILVARGEVRSGSVPLGLAFFEAPLGYIYSASGLIGWLIIVALLACIASLLPARCASRVTVGEILAYEGNSALGDGVGRLTPIGERSHRCA